MMIVSRMMMMMMMPLVYFLFFFTAGVLGQEQQPPQHHHQQLRGVSPSAISSTIQSRRLVDVSYPPSLPYSATPLSNPERGFYTQYSYYASNRETTLLKATSLANLKDNNPGMTLILRLYYLDTFFTIDIDQQTLDDMIADFHILRVTGMKAVIRFAYTNQDCDPYCTTEPAKPQILSHVAQVAPILTAAQDVILAVQAGFIGPWGEWHSSTHFSNPDDWVGRGEVLAALLDAVPDRIVQLRTPEQKKEFYYEVTFPEPTTGHVTNGGFEGGSAAVTNDWYQYSNGYSVSTDEIHSGTQSIMVTNGGAKQYVYVNAPAGSTIEISGYSKGVGVATNIGSDYSIYVDVKNVDGTYNWGEIAKFSGTTGDWEYASHTWVATKDIAHLSLHALYRDQATGIAYFDDIQVKVYGLPTSVVGEALDETTAFTGSHMARTGHHNDCFLASSTDYGTYTSSDQSEYPYLSADTKYTAMGGETCNVNTPRSSCSTAMNELELFHYTYLNRGYHQDVLAGWSADGCMEEIAARLGYRLVLLSGSFPSGAPPGGNIPYSITLDNEGYAAPVIPKRVQLVLRETTTGAICAATDTDVDTRTWYGGAQHVLDGTAILPADIPPGTYDLLLNIADTGDALKTNVDFKIKVVNQGDLNEAESGLIDLQQSVVVGSGQTSQAASGSQFAVSCGVEDDILPPPPVITNPASLVENGSFEGDPSLLPLEWSHYMDGYVVEPAQKHSGAQSIKVTNGGAKQYVYVNAVEGSTITISGYSKAVGVASTKIGSDYSLYADVKYKDGSYKWGKKAYFLTSSDWQHSSHSWVAAKDTERLSLYTLFRNQPSGYAYFDDIEVLVTPPLITNGGFEGSDVDASWSAYGNDGYSVSTTESYSGTQSVAVTNGGARQWVTMIADPGSTVRISGCNKSVGTSTGLWDHSIYADVAYSDGTNLWGQLVYFSGGTTDWVCSEKTFSVPADKTVVGMQVIALYRNDPNPGISYFDDVKVEVL